MKVPKSILKLLANDDRPLSRVFGKLRFIFLFFGLLPFEMEGTDDVGYVYVASKVGAYFTAVGLGANVVMSSVCLCLSPTSPFALFSSGNLWLDKAPYYVEMVWCPVCSVLHLMGRKWLFLFCKKILEVDSALDGLRKVEPATSHELKVMAGTWLLCSTFVHYIVKKSWDIAGSTTGVWAFMSWGKATFFFTQFQFVSATVALRKRIEKLNTILQIHIKNRSLFLSQQRLKKTKDHFWTLSCLYEQLMDSAVCLNKIIFPVMLPNVLMVFLDTVYISFVIVRLLIYNSEASLALTASLLIVSSLGLLILGIQLVYCHSTYVEVRKTAVYAHKVYNSLSDEDSEKDSILLFSKQLLGRRTTFFTCGLFILDITLLYSVVSAISTYIVILVQFQFFN